MSSVQSNYLPFALAVTTAAGAAVVLLFWTFDRQEGSKQNQQQIKRKFGKDIRQHDFLYASNMIILDHGSYGGVPIPVIEIRRQYEDMTESNPFYWYRHKVLQYWKLAVVRVAEMVRSSPENISLITNVTHGIMTALRCCKLTTSDAILINNLNYPAFQIAAHEIAEETGASIYSIDITFPIRTADEIVEKYRQAFDEHPDIKFVIIDYIVSATAMVMPVERLVKLTKERNAIAFVDGAHTPGQIDLNLDELNSDYFTGNMHKWAFTPRGCAIFYVNPSVRSQTYSLIASHYRHKGFELDFFQQGTRDYSPLISATAGIQYMNSIGGLQAIRNYNMKLRDDAMKYIVQELEGAKELEIPAEMRSPYMGVFELSTNRYEVSPAGADELRFDLHENFNVEVTIVVVQNKLFCRYSVHVYTVMGDIVSLVDGLKALL